MGYTRRVPPRPTIPEGHPPVSPQASASRRVVGPGHPPVEYQWKKGQSGNPEGGRLQRPELREIRELAATYSVAAIDTLAKIMLNGRTPASVRVAAAQALLDRGYGKPTQPLEHSGPEGTKLFPPASQLSSAQLERALTVIRDLRTELWDSVENGGPPS
jgi:hypothetical protein